MQNIYGGHVLSFCLTYKKQLKRYENLRKENFLNSTFSPYLAASASCTQGLHFKVLAFEQQSNSMVELSNYSQFEG